MDREIQRFNVSSFLEDMDSGYEINYQAKARTETEPWRHSRDKDIRRASSSRSSGYMQ